MNQITTTLPASRWGEVVIKENNEPLVELIETKKLKLGWVKKGYKALFFVRRSVAEKLYYAAERFPRGFVLVVIEGFRTTSSQQEEWNRVWQTIKMQQQGKPDEDIEKIVRLLVAKPLPLANHHCGGAIDVTLGYENGTLVDMGTPYISQITDENTQSKIPMFSPNVSDEAQEFRKILRDVMVQQHFVWYPAEWWHYCYGDRMWAVYTEQKECFYGSVEEF